jgi:hypothetical protein
VYKELPVLQWNWKASATLEWQIFRNPRNRNLFFSLEMMKKRLPKLSGQHICSASSGITTKLTGHK